MYSVQCVVCSLQSTTQDNSEYNALEQDLAVVSLYFGSSTAYGQSSVQQKDNSVNLIFFGGLIGLTCIKKD